MGKGKKKKAMPVGKPVLRELLDGIFSAHPDKTFTYKQLFKALDLNSMGERRLLVEVLDEMCEAGVILKMERERFKSAEVKSYVTGIVDLTAGGAGFVVSEETEEDIYISFKNLQHALAGDRVKVLVYARSRNRRSEGQVVEILERRRGTFVGILRMSGKYAFVEPSGKQLPYDIFIPSDALRKAKNGQKVVVRITDWPENLRNPIGEVVKILGNPGDNNTEMNAIMAEFELPVEFPSSVIKASEHIPEEIGAEEIRNRRDFRDVPTFTIDPKDAKDFDDALSIRPIREGVYEIGIHIADVTHYVKPDSVLDKEAYKRATSVYLVDRTIPMLPERLSNNLCSLRPGEDKLCFSVVVQIDEEGEVLSRWFGRSLIRSDRRFAYEEAQAMIEGGDGDYKREICRLDAIAKRLRTKRFANGSIEFNRIEMGFEIDGKGKPIGVYFKESKDANKLIEEFMLLANKSVAEWVEGNKPGRKNKVGPNKSKTFVYRIHDKPTLEKLSDFNRFISKFGYSLRMNSESALVSSMNQLMEDIKNRPEHNVIEILAVRTMAKAIYSTENIGHYGLAFPYYTHFTSPIRRYPDMMVHRLLSRYMEGGRSVNKKTYESMCEHVSEMEQIAANAERASIKYKQVEFMADKLGVVFEGSISGVTQWGFYVELKDNKCEGLVSIMELEDDYYEFDEKNYCIVGRHKHKKYQLGDTVEVTVVRANLEARQLDFALADKEPRIPAAQPVKNMSKKKSKRNKDEK